MEDDNDIATESKLQEETRGPVEPMDMDVVASKASIVD
jgi:hypothetical protein